MIRYLLDTNILSDLLRRPSGPVFDQIVEAGEDSVATSIIVAGELRYGAAKRGSPQLSQRIEAILAATTVLTFDPPADRRYGELRASLERAGTPIGGNDMLIAAHALALDLTLVTDNAAEFVRIEALRVDNWLRVA